MKNIFCILMLSASFAPSLTFSDCPPPESITISSDFKVTAPDGYRYVGHTYPITATGPVSLAGVDLFSTTQETLPSQGPYKDLHVIYVNCGYGIGMTSPGIYPKGIIIIAYAVPFTTDLDANWSTSPMMKGKFSCTAYKTDCHFFFK